MLIIPRTRLSGLKSPAIFIHKRWAGEARALGGGDRWVAAEFKSEVLLISAQLPHSGRGMQDYEAVLEDINDCFKRNDIHKVFMGGLTPMLSKMGYLILYM